MKGDRVMVPLLLTAGIFIVSHRYLQALRSIVWVNTNAILYQGGNFSTPTIHFDEKGNVNLPSNG